MSEHYFNCKLSFYKVEWMGQKGDNTSDERPQVLHLKKKKRNLPVLRVANEYSKYGTL